MAAVQDCAAAILLGVFKYPGYQRPARNVGHHQ
jgi:hypothetical protein